MKIFATKETNKTIFSFSAFIAFLFSIIAAYTARLWLQKDIYIEETGSGDYIPTLVFCIAYVALYHFVKFCICLHVMYTQKKMGLHITLRELWRHGVKK